MEEIDPNGRILNPHIELFASAFIVKDKQKRFLSLVETASAEKATPGALAKLTEYLDGGLTADLDKRYAREMGHHEDVEFQNITTLPKAIHALFPEEAKPYCFVVSADHPLRFKESPLLKALAATHSGDLITWSNETIYSCVPGKLAIYAPEIGYRILCKRDV